MTKEEQRKMIAEFVERHPDKVKLLPYGINMEFDSYLAQVRRQASFSRHGGSTVRRSRSPFFKRGEGAV